MNYCLHDIVLYFGKKKTFTDYSICYDRVYVCAYCGSKNVYTGSKFKEIVDIRDKKIDINNSKAIYKELYKIRSQLKEYVEQEKLKNNVHTLVLK